MKALKYIFILTILVGYAYSSPSESEILSTLQEYIEANNPNVYDDMSAEELAEVRKINSKYREFSELMGKEETFYFMKLSDSIQQPHVVSGSFVLHVPINYLKHYDEYDDDEKRMIGEFIWEHYQKGDLGIEHLRKVNMPNVVRYLEDELGEEGGPSTGRGYKIKRILDEMYTLAGSEAAARDDLKPNIDSTIKESASPELTIEEPAEVATSDPSEESTEQSSNWWLWLIGAIVIVGGLGLVLRRKS